MNGTELAPVPAFASVVIVNLARISAWLQVITLAVGCAVSVTMLIAWFYKARRERTNDKLAELKLHEAEQHSQ